MGTSTCDHQKQLYQHLSLHMQDFGAYRLALSSCKQVQKASTPSIACCVTEFLENYEYQVHTLAPYINQQHRHCEHILCTGYTQKNGEVSKVNKKFISRLTRAQRTPSAAAAVQVSHALPAVRFSCLLRGRGASFQDGVAAGEGFLCAPF